jgi:hypothetical protein
LTLEIGGKLREIKLRGDLLAYDPTKNEAPLLSAGHLAMLFLPASGPATGSFNGLHAKSKFLAAKVHSRTSEMHGEQPEKVCRSRVSRSTLST